MTRIEAISILSKLAGYEGTMDLIRNYNVSVQDALHMAIKALEAQPNDNWEGYSSRLWKSAYERGKADAEQRWIPVSERLPEEYGMYLVTKVTRKTELEKGYRNYVRLRVEPYTKYTHWGKSTCGNVAWMPLPEPYKAESEDEL